MYKDELVHECEIFDCMVIMENQYRLANGDS